MCLLWFLSSSTHRDKYLIKEQTQFAVDPSPIMLLIYLYSHILRLFFVRISFLLGIGFTKLHVNHHHVFFCRISEHLDVIHTDYNYKTFKIMLKNSTNENTATEGLLRFYFLFFYLNSVKYRLHTDVAFVLPENFAWRNKT